jgi:hypothetical protein
MRLAAFSCHNAVFRTAIRRICPFQYCSMNATLQLHMMLENSLFNPWHYLNTSSDDDQLSAAETLDISDMPDLIHLDN